MNFRKNYLYAWLCLLTRNDHEVVTLTNELIAGESEVANGFYRLSHLSEEEAACIRLSSDAGIAVHAHYADVHDEGFNLGLTQGLP